MSSFEENVFEKDGLEWMNKYLKQVSYYSEMIIY